MIFHCLGLPHTITSQDYCACAYTAKVLKFIRMMTTRGHTCYHYGHPDSTVDCENVEVVSRETFNRVYQPDSDTVRNFFQFSLHDDAYKEAQQRAIVEIGQRKRSTDEFILSFFSIAGKPVCDAHPEMINVEPGIGYANGHFAPYKVFESYALYHAYCGLQAAARAGMKWAEDAVIPNYFDPVDFEFRDGGDYLLFMGRIYEGKGVQHVMSAAAALPHIKFKIAGQNRAYIDDNYGPGKGFPMPPNVEVVGFADNATRRRLYRDAIATFCLSTYLEPFGGVAMESMLSGTPVISSDWGAFAETVLHGITGYRVRTFEQILWAAQHVGELSAMACKSWSTENYTFDPIAHRYEEYFSTLLRVHRDPQRGWSSTETAREELDHLTLDYPSTGLFA